MRRPTPRARAPRPSPPGGGLGAALLLLLLAAPAGAICPSRAPAKGNPAPGGSVPAPVGAPAGGAPSLPARQPGSTPAARALDTLDARTWEDWWEANRALLLPPVRRRDGPAGGPYAETLPTALAPLLDIVLAALRDDDERVREAAAGALAVVPPGPRAHEVRERLRATFERGRPYERDLAGLALARHGDALAADGLRRILANPREERVSRGYAAVALVLLGDEPGLAAVADATTDLGEPEVAGVALLALGRLGGARHLPVLRAAAERRLRAAARLRRVRGDALVALGSLGHPSTVPYLAGLLRDRERAIARSAALALGGCRHDPAAARALVEDGLGADDAFVRAFAAVSLGRVGEASAVPALARRAQDDPCPAVPPFALLGLGLLHHPTAAPFLDEPLREAPRTGRAAAAALAAGLLPAPACGALLVGGLDDGSSPRVPDAAALGLGLLGDRSAVPALGTRLWQGTTRLRPGFAEGLAHLEPRHLAQRLALEAQAARTGAARRAAVGGLGLCAGPEDARALAALWGEASAGDSALRRELLAAMARVLSDREPSFAARLRAHVCYLHPNLVLDHLATLP